MQNTLMLCFMQTHKPLPQEEAGEKERQKGNVHKELNQIKCFGIRLTTCPEEE